MAIYEISGKVVAVDDVQKFASGFVKREIVVNTSSNSSRESPVPFSFKNDKTALLDGVKPGDEVKVKFFIDGRKWDNIRINKTQYFVELTGFGIEVTQASAFTQADAIEAFKDSHGGEFDRDKFVSLCKELVPGKKSKEFTSEDWKKVAMGNGEVEDVEYADPEDLPF